MASKRVRWKDLFLAQMGSEKGYEGVGGGRCGAGRRGSASGAAAAPPCPGA